MESTKVTSTEIVSLESISSGAAVERLLLSQSSCDPLTGGRHRHRDAVPHQPGREVAEGVAVHPLPVAAMDQDRERRIPRRGGPEQVQRLPLGRPVGQAAFRMRRGVAERRGADPARRSR